MQIFIPDPRPFLSIILWTVVAIGLALAVLIITLIVGLGIIVRFALLYVAGFLTGVLHQIRRLNR